MSCEHKPQFLKMHFSLKSANLLLKIVLLLQLSNLVDYSENLGVYTKYINRQFYQCFISMLINCKKQYFLYNLLLKKNLNERTSTTRMDGIILINVRIKGICQFLLNVLGSNIILHGIYQMQIFCFRTSKNFGRRYEDILKVQVHICIWPLDVF